MSNIHPPLTLTDLHHLAELLDATTHNRRVRFSLDGGDNVAEGVARNFTNEEGNYIHPSSDVREGCLWISGFVERFMPVSQVLSLMDLGMFTVDSK